ncbi:amidophosphoribosyltransferase, partial [Acinetobacter baumannii]
NTDSDTEVLLNVLAHEIQQATTGYSLDPAALFKAVAMVHKRVRGSYAVVAQIAGYGLLGFRDPYGIRPMCLGFNESDKGIEYMMASESVALEGMGFRFLRDVNPGEAIFIDNDGKLYNQQCAENPT